MDSKLIAKRLDVRHNVCIRVIDEATGKVISQHEGHNSATNSMITGIAHYLAGDGVLSQSDILTRWIPQYISVGTMGLINQEEDEEGLPAGIGITAGDEAERFNDYMLKVPGYGADGYDKTLNNDREYMGLGPSFEHRVDPYHTVNCELISESYPRSIITYRDIIPETESEYPRTIDLVLSAFVPVGALEQFREEGKDYVFITEAGLWARSTWQDSGDNGLLAGYRITPPNEANWDMSDPANRQILKENIIKVGKNQVVQIVWKIQLGGIKDLGGIQKLLSDIVNVTWREWPTMNPEYTIRYELWPYDKDWPEPGVLTWSFWDMQNP